MVDVSNTFGTLRKTTTEFKQRSSMPSTSNEEPTYVAAPHAGGNDFYGNLNYKPMVANRQNNNETLPYASIHKQRGGSPNRNVRPFPAQVHTLPLNGAMDDSANVVAAVGGGGTVSRGSSYVNVSAATMGRNAPWADVGSLGRPAVNGKPPSGQAAGAAAPVVGQTQRFVGQAERQPSYSSIQSQQLAAAYASTCSPVLSQYRKGSINAYQDGPLLLTPKVDLNKVRCTDI
uniref:Uncharacterized protein n=1 Tax=Romanomermis culicivorax TaxID=13658 RepID=A0A915IVG3_ROMCU